MSNLIPQKRMDRNGRMVTRHVRATSTSSSTAVVPAPQLAANWTPPTKGQNATFHRLHIRGQYQPDKELQGLTKKDGQKGDLSFFASDAQMYEVLSVVSPGDALTLLEDGIRTSDSALEYLHHAKLERLVQDNERLCMEAMKRRIRVQPFMDSLAYGDHTHPKFMDAAEVAGMEGMEVENVLPNAVHSGLVSINDVRTVGSHRFKRHSGWSGRIAGKQLIRIAEGKGGKCTPASLAFLMDRFGESPIMLGSAISIDERYGHTLTSELPVVTDDLVKMEEKMRLSQKPTEQIIWSLKFAAEAWQYRSDAPVHLTGDLIKRYHDAGFDARDVGSGKVGISHLEAVESGNLNPVVVEGWL